MLLLVMRVPVVIAVTVALVAEAEKGGGRPGKEYIRIFGGLSLMDTTVAALTAMASLVACLEVAVGDGRGTYEYVTNFSLFFWVSSCYHVTLSPFPTWYWLDTAVVLCPRLCPRFLIWGQIE